MPPSRPTTRGARAARRSSSPRRGSRRSGRLSEQRAASPSPAPELSDGESSSLSDIEHDDASTAGSEGPTTPSDVQVEEELLSEEKGKPKRSSRRRVHTTKALEADAGASEVKMKGEGAGIGQGNAAGSGEGRVPGRRAGTGKGAPEGEKDVSAMDLDAPPARDGGLRSSEEGDSVSEAGEEKMEVEVEKAAGGGGADTASKPLPKGSTTKARTPGFAILVPAAKRNVAPPKQVKAPSPPHAEVKQVAAPAPAAKTAATPSKRKAGARRRGGPAVAKLSGRLHKSDEQQQDFDAASSLRSLRANSTSSSSPPIRLRPFATTRCTVLSAPCSLFRFAVPSSATSGMDRVVVLFSTSDGTTRKVRGPKRGADGAIVKEGGEKGEDEARWVLSVGLDGDAKWNSR
ncbi:hypothetical protein JCM10207_008629 [Rhodosporidiobolus poonsookiae]